MTGKVRERFLAGESVETIARECYPHDARGVAMKKVRTLLHSWVRLRHMVEAELAVGEDVLTNRCVREGVCTSEEVQARRRVAGLRRRAGRSRA